MLLLTRPFFLLVFLLLGVGSTRLTEDFWTIVNGNGKLQDNRSVADFAKFDNSGLYPAYWITSTHYINQTSKFDSFGFAYIRPDGRICGWFAGIHEAVEVCGGFRVLSIPQYYSDRTIFDWIPSEYGYHSSVGYNGHRIARRIDANGKITFGDANPRSQSYLGVELDAHNDGQLINEIGANYRTKVSLLRLRIPNDARLRYFTGTESKAVDPSDLERFGVPVVMYMPIHLIRDSRNGHLYERKMSDGHIIYYPFDAAAHGAFEMDEYKRRRARVRKHVKRRMAHPHDHSSSSSSSSSSSNNDSTSMLNESAQHLLQV